MTMIKIALFLLASIWTSSCTTTVVDSSLGDWNDFESTVRPPRPNAQEKEMLKILLSNYGSYVFKAQPAESSEGCLTCIGVITNAKILKHFDAIAQKLSPKRNFLIVPVETNDIFSTALPGGYILVSTGALRVAQSDAEAAGLIAMEMAHMDLGHYEDKMNKSSGGPSRVIAEELRTELKVRGLFQFRNTKKQTRAASEAAVAILYRAGIDAGHYYAYLTATQSLGSQQLDASNKTHSSVVDRKNAYKTALRYSKISPAYRRKPVSSYLRLWEELGL